MSHVFWVMLALVLSLTQGAVLAASPIIPERVTINSELLNQKRQLLVFPPRDYDPQKRYPVLYLLHGMPGDHLTYHKYTNIAVYLTGYDMFVVTPDGYQFSWYLDDPHGSYRAYGSFIPLEVVPYIDSHYPTIPDRTGRAIGGLSMGGHGALTIGLKYPNLFGSISSMSGVADLARHGYEYNLDKILGKFKDNKEPFEQNSAYHMVLNGKATRDTAFFIGVGRTETDLLQENRDLQEALFKRKIPVTYVEWYPFTHDPAGFAAHMEEVLLFHDRVFKKATATTPSN